MYVATTVQQKSIFHLTSVQLPCWIKAAEWMASALICAFWQGEFLPAVKIQYYFPHPPWICVWGNQLNFYRSASWQRNRNWTTNGQLYRACSDVWLLLPFLWKVLCGGLFFKGCLTGGEDPLGHLHTNCFNPENTTYT